MHRRSFLTLLGGAAAAWPLAAGAQQPGGCSGSGAHDAAENEPEITARLIAFRQAIAKLGWIEGRNLRIDLPLARRHDRTRRRWQRNW